MNYNKKCEPFYKGIRLRSMQCPKCHKTIEDNATVCPHCKRVLLLECPNCHSLGDSDILQNHLMNDN